MAFTNPATGDTIPQVGDPGTEYATNVSNTLNHLCDLTHTGPDNQDGYQLNQNSLNFTGDLPLNGHNIIAVRSVRMIDETTNLVGSSDTNCVNVVNGELWFNNASGVPEQISGVTAPPSLTLTIKTLVNTNLVILATDVYNAIDVSTTTTPVSITLPLAASVAPGRFFYFYDIGLHAITNNITIQVAGGSGNAISYGGFSSGAAAISENGQSGFIYTDGAANWYFATFQQYVYDDQNVFFTDDAQLIVDGTASLLLLGTETVDGQIEVSSIGTILFDTGGTITGDAKLTGNLEVNTGVIAAESVGAIVSNISGGIQSTTSGGIKTTAINGFVLGGGASDYPAFSANRSKISTLPLQAATLTANWAISIADPSLQSTANNNTNSLIINMPVLHNGATLGSVTVLFSVGQSHSGVPAILPTLSIERISLLTGVITPLGSTQPFTPTPGTGAAWYNGGAVQNLVFTCSGNNVIDNTEYIYYMILTDEQSTNSLADNLYFGMSLSFNSIFNMQFEF